MRIISLGWGVQSFTLAAMVALGELEPVDAAVHADTTYERSATYEFAERWTGWLNNHGVRVVTVQPRDARIIIQRGGEKIYIPAYTDSSNGGGKLRRQCTGRWKIAPIRKWLRENRNGKPVEQLIGISLDEFQRMRDSDVKYITNRWPLIEKRMTRADCETWLLAHGLPVPPKSSCTFCPYHNRAAWHDIKNAGGDEWNRVVEIDNAIREVRPPYNLYLHSSRKPLESIDFRTPQERGQLELWANWDEECSGVCGV